jgi:hypothetical protein
MGKYKYICENVVKESYYHEEQEVGQKKANMTRKRYDNYDGSRSPPSLSGMSSSMPAIIATLSPGFSTRKKRSLELPSIAGVCGIMATTD